MAQEVSIALYGSPAMEQVVPHEVILRFGHNPADDLRWDALVKWLTTDEIDGQYAFEDISGELDDEDDSVSTVRFHFSDPNAAFHFKVRWA